MRPLAAAVLLVGSVLIGVLLRSDGRHLLGLAIATLLLAIPFVLLGRRDLMAIVLEMGYWWIVGSFACALLRRPRSASPGDKGTP